MEITRVPEDELWQLAREHGPQSRAADILSRLRQKRASDRQVSVWKVGAYCFIGPAPDAETEVAMINLAAGVEDAEDADED